MTDKYLMNARQRLMNTMGCFDAFITLDPENKKTYRDVQEFIANAHNLVRVRQNDLAAKREKQ